MKIPIGFIIAPAIVIAARILAVTAARRADYHAHQSTMADAADYVDCIPYHDRREKFWRRIKRCLVFMLRESER